jgi:hypothetical protein
MRRSAAPTRPIKPEVHLGLGRAPTDDALSHGKPTLTFGTERLTVVAIQICCAPTLMRSRVR